MKKYEYKKIKKINYEKRNNKTTAKYIFYLFLLIIIIYIVYYYKNNIIFLTKFNIYKNYIRMCNKLKKLNYKEKENIKNNKEPYLSICIPVYNMEKYIERAILSILNQSFDDYEIIIINDYSDDKSYAIIERLQLQNNKIKIINHERNLGIYKSRVDAVLNSKGKYTLFLDPDDIYLNPYLFKKLYEFNINFNFDIIEFTVYEENEGKNNFYFPIFHTANHYHNFNKTIIFQPELSNILFFEPETKNYTNVICRCIWNKMVKKEVLYKTINFIGNDNELNNFNFAEDTIINIINFQFGNNYSNIDIGGYLYNIRKDSFSHNSSENKRILLIINNILLYFKLFNKYIKYFNKDRNYLFYDFKFLIFNLNSSKNLNKSYFIKIFNPFLNNILKDSNISKDFKIYTQKILSKKY